MPRHHLARLVRRKVLGCMRRRRRAPRLLLYLCRLAVVDLVSSFRFHCGRNQCDREKHSLIFVDLFLSISQGTYRQPGWPSARKNTKKKPGWPKPDRGGVVSFHSFIGKEGLCRLPLRLRSGGIRSSWERARSEGWRRSRVARGLPPERAERIKDLQRMTCMFRRI
jgi:hypothetical protein